jgi:hypothetical protein
MPLAVSLESLGLAALSPLQLAGLALASVVLLQVRGARAQTGSHVARARKHTNTASLMHARAPPQIVAQLVGACLLERKLASVPKGLCFALVRAPARCSRAASRSAFHLPLLAPHRPDAHGAVGSAAGVGSSERSAASHRARTRSLAAPRRLRAEQKAGKIVRFHFFQKTYIVVGDPDMAEARARRQRLCPRARRG